jgi:hypothetical protein
MRAMDTQTVSAPAAASRSATARLAIAILYVPCGWFAALKARRSSP